MHSHTHTRTHAHARAIYYTVGHRACVLIKAFKKVCRIGEVYPTKIEVNWALKKRQLCSVYHNEKQHSHFLHNGTFVYVVCCNCDVIVDGRLIGWLSSDVRTLADFVEEPYLSVKRAWRAVIDVLQMNNSSSRRFIDNLRHMQSP